MKARVDQLLVARGLAASRSEAQALLLAGRVFHGELRIDKPGTLLQEDCPLRVSGPLHPFVSRGGVKLAGALRAFDLAPTGWIVADFGASTGGFTDCLLQAGAARVYAIDVGRGQLADLLRRDPRVVVMEKTNARSLTRESLPEPVALVTIDASFIGLAKLLPAAQRVLQPGGQVLALVKPQFEVGRQHVGKGGIVRDPFVRKGAVDDVARAAAALGFVERGRYDSDLKGQKGNQETILWLTTTLDRAALEQRSF